MTVGMVHVINKQLCLNSFHINTNVCSSLCFAGYYSISGAFSQACDLWCVFISSISGFSLLTLTKIKLDSLHRLMSPEWIKSVFVCDLLWLHADCTNCRICVLETCHHFRLSSDCASFSSDQMSDSLVAYQCLALCARRILSTRISL